MTSALLALDLGNSRFKFGLFDAAVTNALPRPIRSLDLSNDEWDEARVRELSFDDVDRLDWSIASVNRDSLEVVTRWIAARRAERSIPPGEVRILTRADLPIVVRTEHPDQVGIDRLLGAIGANRLRAPDRAAVTMHLGTALTVNFIDAHGAFCGGAILPGIGLSARALHDFTDALPLIPMRELADPPPPIGRETVAAMRSGLYWGAVGAMRELLARFSDGLDHPPEVYLTGGAAPHVAAQLAPQARLVPELILGAIAVLGIGSRESGFGKAASGTRGPAD